MKKKILEPVEMVTVTVVVAEADYNDQEGPSMPRGDDSKPVTVYKYAWRETLPGLSLAEAIKLVALWD